LTAILKQKPTIRGVDLKMKVNELCHKPKDFLIKVIFGNNIQGKVCRFENKQENL